MKAFLSSRSDQNHQQPFIIGRHSTLFLSAFLNQNLPGGYLGTESSDLCVILITSCAGSHSAKCRY